MDQLVGFLIAGFALIASPGPNTLTIAATAAAFGARKSLRILAGLALGMMLVMLMTASGIAAAIATVPGVVPILSLAAALYFLYLAYRIATAPPLKSDSSDRPAPSMRAGLAVCLVNPKAYAAMTALFSGFILTDTSPLADAVLKTALLTVMVIVVNLGWMSVGAALTRHLKDPRTSRLINIAFAGLLIVTLAMMMLGSRP